MDKAKILLVDDEEDILEFLKYNLEKDNYQIKVARSGEEAIRKIEKFNPHLVVLDIMMPEMDGIEVCKIIRENKDYKNILIAFLTARGESFTQIMALESGGDDFIIKPIKPSVFRSRVKALLRRHINYLNYNNENILAFGDLKIDLEKFKVTQKGKKVKLAKKEFELLKLLTSKPGKVFKRAEILSHVWGSDVIVGDRTIDVHIRKLREKIGSKSIVTFKGIGYKFDF
jgi:two-component system alkaline phosphatase synthesis response regulator PhoP